jgi:hypothetical protein
VDSGRNAEGDERERVYLAVVRKVIPIDSEEDGIRERRSDLLSRRFSVDPGLHLGLKHQPDRSKAAQTERLADVYARKMREVRLKEKEGTNESQ